MEIACGLDDGCSGLRRAVVTCQEDGPRTQAESGRDGAPDSEEAVFEDGDRLNSGWRYLSAWRVCERQRDNLMVVFKYDIAWAVGSEFLDLNMARVFYERNEQSQSPDVLAGIGATKS